MQQEVEDQPGKNRNSLRQRAGAEECGRVTMEWAQCEQQGCTTNGTTYYLFDKNTLEPIGSPSEKQGDLYKNLPAGVTKAGTSHRIRSERRARGTTYACIR